MVTNDVKTAILVLHANGYSSMQIGAMVFKQKSYASKMKAYRIIKAAEAEKSKEIKCATKKRNETPVMQTAINFSP